MDARPVRLQGGVEVLQVIVDVMPDAALAVAADGTVVAANADATRLFSYAAEALIGISVEMLVPERLREVHRAERMEFAADPQRRPMGRHVDLRARRRDGSEFAADIMLGPLELEGRLYVLAAVRDRSLQEEAADQLRRAYRRQEAAAQQLRELDRMKDAFLRTVSHDVGNPLTAIIGLAETMRALAPTMAPEDLERMLDRIAANARRIDHLVHDLLDLDRLNVAAGRPEPSSVDVVALARDVALRATDDDHPVSIDGEQLVADVDPLHLERVIDNLVSNAARHTPGGTPVTVRMLSVGRDLELIVEDAGPGVPDHLKRAVFEPFISDSASKGTGLGLSVVSRFAELNGGRAWVEDRPGGGASFHVLLPGAITASSI